MKSVVDNGKGNLNIKIGQIKFQYWLTLYPKVTDKKN